MASDWITYPNEISGINLANYYPQQRSFNSVVYVHKKYLNVPKPQIKKEKVKLKKDKRIKQDKAQQFNGDKNTDGFKDKAYKSNFNYNDNSVLEQTIRFAKNIVPLVIPPSEDKSNVFYTIKSTKKSNKHDKKPHSNYTHTVHREEPKKVVETYRKVKKESFSVKESISHSSNNTLDDLNINQSLCCTFSEVSEKKFHKKAKNRCNSRNKEQKIAISDSFEAIATESAAAGDANIKIHLMNDKDKHFLSESIKEPVLNAIRDCILELNSNNINSEITTVQKFIKCNSQKLDIILEKLAYIENKLDIHEKKLDENDIKMHEYEHNLESHEKRLDSFDKSSESRDKSLDEHEKKLEIHSKQLDTYEKRFDHINDAKGDDIRIPHSKVLDKPKAKASILEELGEDIIELKEDYSSEEELHQERLDRKSSSVIEYVQDFKEEKLMENLGAGEVPRIMKPSASAGNKLERPNRVPARFCWTGVRNN